MVSDYHNEAFMMNFTSHLSKFFILLFLLIVNLNSLAQTLPGPTNLRVQLLEHPETSFQNGFPTNLGLNRSDHSIRPLQQVLIQSKKPIFSWATADTSVNVLQSAYQILVSTVPDQLNNDKGEVWNSGKIFSDQSVGIPFQGSALQPNTIYYWKVKTWNNQDVPSAYSTTKSFKTGEELLDYTTALYPLQKESVFPIEVKKIENGIHAIDFEKDAFGQLSLYLFSSEVADTIQIHIGEVLTESGKIDRDPGGTRRYQNYKIPLLQGWHQYNLVLHPDERNTGPNAIKMPDYIGEVTPFRYCEIENYHHPIEKHQVIRNNVFYFFNDDASYFHSSDSVLNAVWELCKYSIKATSFAGIYVDGDRERIPYEADAYINQLCHYGVDNDYSLARFSHEYLINHPTWPTEWILQSVLMAWNDYLYTGDISSVRHFYDDLKAKSLLPLANEDGLISTKTGKVTQSVLDAIHYKGDSIRDIVDWPHSGILGLGKEEAGETDGFIFRPINTVVNAYHYQALVVMSKLANDLGKSDDAALFTKRAEKVRKSFNQQLFNKVKGIYVDGVGTEHSSLHANMFALAFDLVPEKYKAGVFNFIESRGMACSVYGSQFLMDAVYDGYGADYGLSLLASTSERSWYNMIRAGSTITMEAWDNKYKPNQDWNHAWGAVPANIIPRKLMGIEPIEPGFKKFSIKPQPGTLKTAEMKLPTIRGNIKAQFQSDENKFVMEVQIPANTSCDIFLPARNEKAKVLMDGKIIKTKTQNKFLEVQATGSGKHTFQVSYQ